MTLTGKELYIRTQNIKGKSEVPAPGPLGKLFMLLCCLLGLFKINFLEKFFQEYHDPMSNRLDRDHAWHFVGPNLGQICLQRLRAKINPGHAECFYAPQSSQLFCIPVFKMSFQSEGKTVWILIR